MYKLIVVALALVGSIAAHAQTDGRPDPTEPNAAVPPAQYRSAFTDYRAHKEPEVANWRDLNEAVGAAGGHAGLTAKPSGAPKNAQPSSAAPSDTAPRPPAGGHAGHHR